MLVSTTTKGHTMTANFRALVSKNPLIATEFAKTGKMVNKPSENHFFKQKSEAQKAREAITQKYESRANQCPTCFMAIPLTGTCVECE